MKKENRLWREFGSEPCEGVERFLHPQVEGLGRWIGSVDPYEISLRWDLAVDPDEVTRSSPDDGHGVLCSVRVTAATR
jgi:hypothetical protein